MQTMPGMMPGYLPESDARDMLVGVSILLLPTMLKLTPINRNSNQ